MIISDIAVAPVKGLGLNHPDAVQVTEAGIVGDRRYAIVDERGHVFNGKRCGALVQVRATLGDDPESLSLLFPDGQEVQAQVEIGEAVPSVFYGQARATTLVLGDFSRALSTFAGEPVRLVRLPDGGGIDRVGSGSISLQSTASLQALERATGSAEMDARRFRMTFTVTGAGEHQEDEWLGRRVRIGDAVVVPEGNVGRCAVTRQNPDTGVSDIDTLGAIADYRANVPTTERLPFGIHARVIAPGRVAVGDPVTVE